MIIERCPTGVTGLDELMEGGFPRGRVILLTGGCGTGKSILGSQFLYNGVVNFNEPGVLLTLEQNPDRIRQEMKLMGFDLERLEKEGKLAIVDASLSDLIFKKRSSAYTISSSGSFGLESILGFIEDAVSQVGAKRAVVDSLSALDALVEAKKAHVSGSQSQDDSRKALLSINYKLQSLGLTSILISDLLDDGTTPRHGIEEFIADGVISFHYNVSGPDIGRHLIIKKMRCTKHSENINMIELVSGEGIRVKGL